MILDLLTTGYGAIQVQGIRKIVYLRVANECADRGFDVVMRCYLYDGKVRDFDEARVQGFSITND